MPLLAVLGAVGSGLGSIGSAFDKDRYKTEYHGATLSVKDQNEQIKQQIKQLEELKRKGLLSQKQTNLTLPIPTNQNDMNTNFLKEHKAKLIGGVIAVVAVVIIVITMKRKKSKLS